jgi:hypothetical protein
MFGVQRWNMEEEGLVTGVTELIFVIPPHDKE